MSNVLVTELEKMLNEQLPNNLAQDHINMILSHIDELPDEDWDELPFFIKLWHSACSLASQDDENWPSPFEFVPSSVDFPLEDLSVGDHIQIFLKENNKIVVGEVLDISTKPNRTYVAVRTEDGNTASFLKPKIEKVTFSTEVDKEMGIISEEEEVEEAEEDIIEPSTEETAETETVAEEKEEEVTEASTEETAETEEDLAEEEEPPQAEETGDTLPEEEPSETAPSDPEEASTEEAQKEQSKEDKKAISVDEYNEKAKKEKEKAEKVKNDPKTKKAEKEAKKKKPSLKQISHEELPKVEMSTINTTNKRRSKGDLVRQLVVDHPYATLTQIKKIVAEKGIEVKMVDKIYENTQRVLFFVKQSSAFVEANSPARHSKNTKKKVEEESA